MELATVVPRAGVVAVTEVVEPPTGGVVVAEGADATEGTAPVEPAADTDGSGADRSPWAGRGVVLAITAAVVAGMLRAHGGVAGSEVASSWQLIDLHALRHDLFGSIWYLHTQPPLHNAVVGAVVAWSPFPVAGTLFVLYTGCLAGLGLTLHALLVRWRVPSVAAGVVAGVAVANPALLHSITLASYEVPLAFLVALLVWLLVRHLDDPRPTSFVAIAATATVITMTRSLFHPVWLVGLLLLVGLTRPVSRRALAIGALIPLVVVGGWMAKNEVLFGSASLSSWDGFNLQRGVTNPMDRTTVEAAVHDGSVSSLALVRPWQQLDAYRPWIGACRPAHHRAATDQPTKRVSGQDIANFNDDCYLPLYAKARHDAIALIERDPGTYLARRLPALALSHSVLPLGRDPSRRSFLGERQPSASWMDHLYGPLMGRQTITVSMASWDQSLLGADLVVTIGWTLVVLSLLMLARTLLAVVRVVRARVRHADLVTRELVWLLVGGTYLFVVVGGDLIELGENGRFRTMLDPIVLTLLAAEAWAWLASRRDRRVRSVADS